MRPDLYRPVKIVIPKNKYRLAIIARDVFGYQPVSLQVAEHAGDVIGAVFVQSLSRSPLSWSKFEKEAYLDNVAVLPNYRKHGIGSALLQAAQEWAKQTGHTHMWGKIVIQNEISRAFFKKAGFTDDCAIVGLSLTKNMVGAEGIEPPTSSV